MVVAKRGGEGRSLSFAFHVFSFSQMEKKEEAN